MPAARPEVPQVDSQVVAALRKSWRAQYDSSDEDVANQEVELMKERGHCSYMALEEGVEAQHFHGVSNFLVMPQYVQVAKDALEMLDVDACYSAVVSSKKELKHKVQPKLKGQDSKHIGEKMQDSAMKEGKSLHEKPQTAAGISIKPMCESERPKPKLGHDANEDKRRNVLWDLAEAKAHAELQEEFNYNALCKQGRQLFHIVHVDKTKRLFNKLKQRARWKAKQMNQAKRE